MKYVKIALENGVNVISEMVNKKDCSILKYIVAEKEYVHQ